MFRKTEKKAAVISLLYPLLISLSGAIAYSNTFHVPFIFDDQLSIADNKLVHNINNFFLNSSGHSYNPRRFIGYLTFALNYHFGGLNVAGYHAVNLAIHIATSLLVYLLVLLTFRTPAMRPQSSDITFPSVLSPQHSALSPQSSALSPQSSFFSTSNLIAFFSAALFAVHPIQTEAVTYIVQRLTSLTAFFYLLSLTAYIKFRLIAECKGQSTENAVPYAPPEAGSSRFATYAVSLVSAVLAMKTKEIAFTLPFIIVLYELVFFGTRKLTRRILWLLPLLATAAIIPLSMLSLTVHTPLGKAISDMSQAAVVDMRISRWEYLITEFTVIVKYIKLLFFPVGQNIDYDYPIYRSFFYPQVMLSFLFLLFLFGLGICLVLMEKIGLRGRRGLRERRGLRTEEQGLREGSLSEDSVLSPQLSVLNSQSSVLSPVFKLMGFGILWFFITLSVESSIIPITDVICEHRVYLPSIGMIICVVTGVFLLAEKIERSVLGFRPSVLSPRFSTLSPQSSVLDPQSSALSSKSGKIVIAIMCLAITVLSVATYLRNDVWGDDIRLWKDIAAKSPKKERPHYNLGRLYQARRIFADAVTQYRAAIDLNPKAADAHNNLGAVYQEENMSDKALEQYLIALDLQPAMPEVHYNLGNFYKDRNMTQKAINEYLIAISLRPDYMEAHLNLGGEFYQSAGMSEKALKEYLIAVKLKPECAEAYNNLGAVYESLNRPDKAAEDYAAAVKLKPDYFEARANLAELYYKTGQIGKARDEMKEGLKIRPGDEKATRLLNNLSRIKP